MRQNQIKNVGYLKERRRELRNEPTDAENELWQALKGHALENRKFRRQQSIENYIVDFYCATEKLIIELNGDIHNDPEQMRYDIERDKRLTDLGNSIIRFKNELIFADIETSLKQ